MSLKGIRYTVIVIVILFFIIALTNVPTFSLNTNRSIHVESFDFDESNGHIDLLVRRTDFEGEVSSVINPEFKIDYPNYELFDYLNEDEWISYYAFVDGAECGVFPRFGSFFFGLDTYEVGRLKDVKLIHVDTNGDTVKISEIIKVPKLYFYSTLNDINYENFRGTFDTSITTEFHISYLMWDLSMSIIVGVLIAYAFFRKNDGFNFNPNKMFLIDCLLYVTAFFIIAPFLTQYYSRFFRPSVFSTIIQGVMLPIIIIVKKIIISKFLIPVSTRKLYAKQQVKALPKAILLPLVAWFLLMVYKGFANFS